MRLLTAKQVADILQVKPARVYELVRENVLPATRLGNRQIRFEEDELADWIKKGGSTKSQNCQANG